MHKLTVAVVVAGAFLWSWSAAAAEAFPIKEGPVTNERVDALMKRFGLSLMAWGFVVLWREVQRHRRT